MNLSHIEHLGIAVKSIEEALPFFEGVLGLTCYNIEEVADQKVRTAFLKIGEVKLELLEPTSDESPIAKFIEKRGEGIHHLALSSDDVAPASRSSRARAYASLMRSLARVLRVSTLPSFTKSAHGILLEICDCKDVAK
ncbi:VOC family protein [Porphyromonas uenonis]|uniref:VOC family protein n=1 Tax=Porphyromonas uenonis TaxID=281920 RepID=UPI000A70B768|nr:VOC family protein [Porphyromonas uenonis]